MFVVTGPPDPAAPSRQDREASPARALEAAHEHLLRGDTAAAMEAFREPPEPEPTWQMEPWAAVMAKVLAKDDPLGTALEQMREAQAYADQHWTPDHHLRGVLVGRRRTPDRPGHHRAALTRRGRAVHERPGAARAAAADP